MSEYRSIKDLVVDACMSDGEFPSYEKLTSLVLKHFPTSKWQKSHYAWYKSKIKNGEIPVPGFVASDEVVPSTMVKNHIIVLKNENGDLEKHAMKEWLRRNPQYLPTGFHPDSNTSHEIRRALNKNGWGLEIGDNQVLLIKPDESGDTTFADEVIEAETSSENEEDLECSEITFGLESDLQQALRTNISQLESGLKIIDGGKERSTEAGRIDITAEDARGNVVIIELKAGMATPQIIAQVLAYMGAVSQNDNKPVKGILVAGDFHKKVVLAARTLPNVELKKYSFQFTFESVE